jgi:hypothetical protein
VVGSAEGSGVGRSVGLSVGSCEGPTEGEYVAPVSVGVDVTGVLEGSRELGNNVTGCSAGLSVPIAMSALGNMVTGNRVGFFVVGAVVDGKEEGTSVAGDAEGLTERSVVGGYVASSVGATVMGEACRSTVGIAPGVTEAVIGEREKEAGVGTELGASEECDVGAFVAQGSAVEHKAPLLLQNCETHTAAWYESSLRM